MAAVGGRVSSRKGRPNYAREFKRQLAAAACAPDVSVAKLAQTHGVNANMLFKWRRHYRAGQLGRADADQPVMLPVVVRTAEEARPSRAAQRKPASVDNTSARREVATAVTSCIEIEVAGVTVRLRGAIDVVQLRSVLRCLGGTE